MEFKDLTKKDAQISLAAELEKLSRTANTGEKEVIDKINFQWKALKKLASIYAANGKGGVEPPLRKRLFSTPFNPNNIKKTAPKGKNTHLFIKTVGGVFLLGPQK